MKKDLRKLCALVAIVMLITSLAACATATPAPTTAPAASQAQTEAPTAAPSAPPTQAPTVDMTYYVPGADETDLPNVLALVNAQMKTDGVGVNLIIKHLGWDVWSDRVNVMLSTGEKFDLMEVMENWIPSSVYVSRGGLMALDDLITQYGPALKQAVPDYCWNQITIGGKIYAVPAYWRDTTQLGSPVGSIEVRKDLLDKYNLPVPKTFEDVVNDMTAVKAADPSFKDSYFYDHSLVNSAAWLERTFDTFPFYSDFSNEIVCVREDGTVEPWISTSEFKQECMDYREMYTKGLINPDILSVPSDVAVGNTMAKAGKLIISESGDYSAFMQSNPDAKIVNVMLAPDKPSYVSLPLWNSNAVPASSQHPEAAIKFINWLYTSQANHDLFIYGKEGVDYTVVDQYRVNFINDKSGAPLYGSSYDWMIGNYKWLKLPASTSDADIALQIPSDKPVKISIVAGFSFNSDPVKNEFANVSAAIPEAIYPLRYGVVEYNDANYAAALAKLKAAGLDAVVAEYKKQFDAWRASK